MNAHILKFFSKLADDDELKKKFINKPLKEKYSVAIQNSTGPFTEKEFTDAMADILKCSAETNTQNDSTQIDENSLQNVSGGGKGVKDKLKAGLEMADMLQLKDLGKDYNALGKMGTGSKLELIDAFDDFINAGAMVANSIYKVVHKYKESSKHETRDALRREREALEQRLKEAQQNQIK